MNRGFEIFDHLESNSIKVHFPTKKLGKCDEPYVVIKDMGKFSHNGSTGHGLVHLLVYAPRTNYEAFIAFVGQVKTLMLSLKNIKATGMETPVIYEDLIDAFSTSIEYQYFKTI